jgi:hypothetical protein
MTSSSLRLLSILGVVIGLGCGKVTDPLPPLTTTPEAVGDLSVQQVGYDLVLGWTNPARNVDQTELEDLQSVRIRADGEFVAQFPVTGPGQAQTARLADARGLIGSSRDYTVQLVAGRDRVSAESNTARLGVVAVPGPVSDIRATVDQNRIALAWSPPAERPDLVGAYRVYRSGVRAADTVEPRFEDTEYSEGAVNTYRIAALRGATGIEGVSSGELTVSVLDTVAPGPPTGLGITVVDAGAFLVWEAGPERDIAGYRVYRRESAGEDFSPLTALRMTTGFTDPGFEAGFQYAVSAIDRSGNESPVSEPSEP